MSVSPLSRVLCAECFAALSALDDASLARAVATPVTLPAAFIGTHTVCHSCQSVRRVGDAHEAYCALHATGLVLSVVGWASGTSEALRDDLRRVRSRTNVLVSRLLAIAARDALRMSRGGIYNAVDTVVAHIPMSGATGADVFASVAANVAVQLGLPFIEGLLARDKRRSTRGSVAEARARIASNEYRVVPEPGTRVVGRRIVLLDDTVTTGHTMAGVAHMLRESGALEVLPVVLDRVVSARLLQRVTQRAADRCPHVPAALRSGGRPF
ncbi:phosphoribosyltransferase family protein [Archangium sp.]|uniref:phosphoribosyltransferase family protein n=1 Tax=Archangium sp. TaxID=1872627 RepID=UPI0039C8A343